MILCEYCLVAFPIPENRTHCATSPPNSSTPLPIKMQPQSEIDIDLHRLGADSGWRLVSLGLTVVQYSMVVFLVAGLLGVLALIFDTIHIDPLFSSDRPVLILAGFVTLAAGLTGLMGICLCCNAPGERWLKNYARACAALMVVGGLTGAVPTALPDRNGPSIWYAVVFLNVIAFSASVAAIILWVQFLKGVGEFFHSQGVANGAGGLLAASIFGMTINSCVVFPATLATGVYAVVSLAIPCLLYIWLLLLVIKVRRLIPLRHHRGHW
jgi:hypothetical protein